MKFTTITLATVAASLAHFSPVEAGEPAPASFTEDIHNCGGQWSSARPDGHAPIGVMLDHTHHAGDWMLSYRYMFMHMDGNRMGSNSISDSDVYAAGYAVAPQEMDMHMHMFGTMYAPTDWLTLAVMTSYNTKDMTLKRNPHMHMHGHGGHSGTFGHSSEGWGDTTLTGLFQLFNAGGQSAHIGLGIGLPTADVEEMQDGHFLPYGMQLGRGLWDLRPSITYLGQCNWFSWGAQASGIIGLEDENSAGYAPGDVFNTTGWLAAKLNDWASISARLNYTHQSSWSGHYNGPHHHAAPPHFIDNYGGDILEGGIGLNLYNPLGLKGHRVAVEALFPIHQDVEGIQMDRDFSIVVGWQFAF